MSRIALLTGIGVLLAGGALALVLGSGGGGAGEVADPGDARTVRSPARPTAPTTDPTLESPGELADPDLPDDAQATEVLPDRPPENPHVAGARAFVESQEETWKERYRDHTVEAILLERSRLIDESYAMANTLSEEMFRRGEYEVIGRQYSGQPFPYRENRVTEELTFFQVEADREDSGEVRKVTLPIEGNEGLYRMHWEALWLIEEQKRRLREEQYVKEQGYTGGV